MWAREELLAIGPGAVQRSDAYEERVAIVMEAGDVHELRAQEIAMHDAVTADQLNLRVIYAIPAGERRPIIAGKVKCSQNGVDLTFCENILDDIVAGRLRPFVFLAAFLETWPELPAGIGQRPKETVVWANPKGKRPDHRPLVWEGWPIRPDLVLLVPATKKLTEHEREQSGFVCKLRNPDGSVMQAAPVRPKGGPDGDGGGDGSGAPAEAGDADRGGGLRGAGNERVDGLRPADGGVPPVPVGRNVPAQSSAQGERELPRDGEGGAREAGEGAGGGVRSGLLALPDDSTWGAAVAWIREHHARGHSIEELAPLAHTTIENARYALEPQSWERDEERKGGYVSQDCGACGAPVTLTSSGYPMCPAQHVAGALCPVCNGTMTCVGWEPINEHGNPPHPILRCDACERGAYTQEMTERFTEEQFKNDSTDYQESCYSYGMDDLISAEPFAGAGGLSLGLDSAGFAHVWAGEMSNHACDTYAAAFPGVALHRGKLTGEEALPVEVGRLDLLAGGPPCQPFSNAGDKRGQWDERDGFPIFLRLVERYQPRAILMENVKGLLAKRHEGYVEAICQSLEALGYFVQVRVLQAADFGVPQRRERAIFVGFRDQAQAERFRWPTPTHSLEALCARKYPEVLAGDAPIPEEATRFEAAALRMLTRKTPRKGSSARASWDAAQAALGLKPWVTVREALGELVQEFLPGETLHVPPVPGHLDAELVDEGRGGEAGEAGTSREKSLLYKHTRPDVPADTVSAAAEQKGSEHCARITLRARAAHGYGESEHSIDEPSLTLTTNPKNNPQLSIQVKNGRYRSSERGIDSPVSTVAGSWAKDKPQLVVRNLDAGDGLGARIDDVAPTVPADAAGQAGLAAMDASEVHEWVGGEGTTEPGRVHRRPSTVLRRLSHVEVARLQAFPDAHPWHGPSTAVYRQIGNAVPPKLGEVVARSIRAALRPKRKKKPRAII